MSNDPGAPHDHSVIATRSRDGIGLSGAHRLPGMTSFRDAIEAGPVVLDGGLGTLLEARGNDLSSPLWSARLLLEHPAEIRAAHAEFFAAGARVAITSSYQVSYEALEPWAWMTCAGRPAAHAQRPTGTAGARRRRARRRSMGGGIRRSLRRVACGRQRVHGRLRPDGRRAARVAPAAASCARGGRPDLLAVETIPSLAEVEAISSSSRVSRAPAWLSVTIADGALRSGDGLAEAMERAAASRAVVAVGVNCCDAREVAPALTIARSVTDKPLLAYPNSGETWDAVHRTGSASARRSSRHVPAWIDAGARLVGGCCRVTPAQISSVSAAVVGAAAVR